MGGNVPLGYDQPAPGSRALAINPAEADTVRTIFRSYLELGSVHALQRWLDARGIRSKSYVSRSGRRCGGQSFSRGALFHLLRNRIYLGLIVHKGAAYPAMHPAIIEADLFEAVQEKLDANVRRQEAQRRGAANAPLTGRIFDAEGQPMSPTFSYGKKGKLYRYYVSAPLQQGQMRASDDGMVRRIAAARLESGLADIVRTVTGSRAADTLDLITRVELYQKTVHCLMPVRLLPAIRDRLSDDLEVEADAADPTKLRLKVPLVRRAGQTWILEGVQRSAKPDPVLVKALRSAHTMLAHDDGGRPVLAASPETFHRRRLLRLAFLAPDLQRAILEGHQPKDLTLAHLLHREMPLDWSLQARRFGFC